MEYAKEFTAKATAAFEAMEQLNAAVAKINALDAKDIVEAVSADNATFSMFEPTVLKSQVEQVLEKLNDARLLMMVQWIDPNRTKTNESGRNWFHFVKDQGRVTVDGIKLIREQLDYRMFGVAEAKKIAELIVAGVIK